jgi:hypothetical protein
MPIASVRKCLACMVLLSSALVVAQKAEKSPQRKWSGTWVASAPPASMFRGEWKATLLSGNTHDAARGSWTLLNQANRVVMEGTWSAKKAANAWQGTWSARVKGGAALSGTWTANAPDVSAKTFEDLLSLAIQQQVSGFWQMGRTQGSWWLRGPN